ncbi:M1 family metallopeptidase [Aureisphaera galaxeae]|uniref:M1 family metallopeptidase n=1 Tax=Aureisphaera galaxeae TaxID=1538023 RepID=UPI002350CCCD|nr:M1 family metallopeptidase [Aureisphaera galaxeae]MDC8004906.1 M1 family metallopeptidase [Aureisphaera galaxeae]
MVFSQQTDVVDFTNISALIAPDIESREVQGELSATFKMLKQTDSIYLDAVAASIVKNVTTDIQLRVSDDKLWMISNFQKDSVYEAKFIYTMVPKRAMYFTYDQVWTQGQGKYTSNWLPSIDDMNDKIEFDLKVVAEKGKTVIANGRDVEHIGAGNNTIWSFDMEKPMSSYLVAFAMGDFVKKEIRSESGIPIELYLRPEDSLKMEPTYRHTKEIFDFFEKEIGVPYPWQNYKQVPVRDFLYAGMENTTATLFSEAFVVDSIGFHDRNYVNVNAHELAHQWFGNLVTETEGKHHWLHEGFATYYALLAERHLFGDDYYYWKLYNTAEQLRSISDQGKGQSLLNPKASSLTFYEKGAWALHILNELIGEEAFKKAIKNYLEKYQFKNVTTDDFLAEVRAVSSVDISAWEKDWLKQSAFKAEQALNSLTNSEFLTTYFELVSLREMTISDKSKLLEQALQSGNDYLAEEAVIQLALEKGKEVEALYEMAFKGNTTTRQAIALSMEPPVSEALKSAYETLLKDKSYTTQESALYILWASYPQERARYLDEMKYAHGFQNKNIRLLWLALALSTEGYATSAKPLFEKELRNYSRPDYSYEIRETAFQYISSLGNWNEEVIKNLVNGCTHHYWRFRDYCRELLDELLKSEELKQYLQSKKDSFSDREKAYLERVL